MAYIKHKKTALFYVHREDLQVVGCEDHIERAKQAADKGITLVKNTLDQLPIRPETHKRIRLYFLEGEKGGIYEADSETLELHRGRIRKTRF